MTTWHIAVRGVDDWPDEYLDLSSDEGHSYWFDGGVVVQTHPTGFGNYHVERVVSWTQVIEWSRDDRTMASRAACADEGGATP